MKKDSSVTRLAWMQIRSMIIKDFDGKQFFRKLFETKCSILDFFPWFILAKLWGIKFRNSISNAKISKVWKSSFLKTFFMLEIEQESEKPTRDFKFSSKNGSLSNNRMSNSRVCLWEFLNEIGGDFKFYYLIENGSLSNSRMSN